MINLWLSLDDGDVLKQEVLTPSPLPPSNIPASPYKNQNTVIKHQPQNEMPIQSLSEYLILYPSKASLDAENCKDLNDNSHEFTFKSVFRV